MDIGIQKRIPRYYQIVITDDLINNTRSNTSSIAKMKKTQVFERLSILQVIGVWIIGILLFGLIYFSLTFTNHPLVNNGKPLTNNLNGLGNSLYFSCITAMTIGYNDITPIGFSKLLVILEAVFSIALLGLFIAKIVSVKQEVLEQFVEELSFEESTNSAISELYIFRSDVRTITETIHTSKDKKGITTQVKNFEQSLNTLKLALNNIERATTGLSTEQKHNASLRIELILNSVNFSLSRMIELIEVFDHRKADWKKESTTATIAECNKMVQKLYEEYSQITSNTDAKVAEKLEDLNKTLTTLQETISKA